MNFEYVDNLAVVTTRDGLDITYAEARMMMLLMLEDTVGDLVSGPTDSGVTSVEDWRAHRADALLFFCDGRYEYIMSLISADPEGTYPEGVEERLLAASLVIKGRYGPEVSGMCAVLVWADDYTDALGSEWFWKEMDRKFPRLTPSGKRARRLQQDRDKKAAKARARAKKRIQSGEKCSVCGHSDWENNGRCRECRKRNSAARGKRRNAEGYKCPKCGEVDWSEVKGTCLSCRRLARGYKENWR